MLVMLMVVVVTCSDRDLIGCLPVSQYVHYLVSPWCQVYNLLPIANYKSKLFIFIKNIKICDNQIFH